MRSIVAIACCVIVPVFAAAVVRFVSIVMGVRTMPREASFHIRPWTAIFRA